MYDSSFIITIRVLCHSRTKQDWFASKPEQKKTAWLKFLFTTVSFCSSFFSAAADCIVVNHGKAPKQLLTCWRFVLFIVNNNNYTLHITFRGKRCHPMARFVWVVNRQRNHGIRQSNIVQYRRHSFSHLTLTRVDWLRLYKKIEFTRASSATHRKQTEFSREGVSACVSFELNSDHMNLSFYTPEEHASGLYFRKVKLQFFASYLYMVLVRQANTDTLVTSTTLCSQKLLRFGAMTWISLFHFWSHSNACRCGSIGQLIEANPATEKKKKVIFHISFVHS